MVMNHDGNNVSSWESNEGPPLYKKLFFEPEVTINLESKIGLFYKKNGFQ